MLSAPLVPSFQELGVDRPDHMSWAAVAASKGHTRWLAGGVGFNQVGTSALGTSGFRFVPVLAGLHVTSSLTETAA